MATQAAKRVSRACDACKLRKVKCNGQERCQQCSHLNLRCVYSVAVRKRSQGKRGRIITEYKNKTSNSMAVSTSILPASEDSPSQWSPTSGRQDSVDQVELTSPTTIEPQYDPAFFLNLLPDYVSGVYPFHPVITEQELRDYISIMPSDHAVRSFIFAFGACTLNLTRYGAQRTDAVQQTIEALMNHSITTMAPPYKSHRPSIMRAMQSTFIHNCLMSIQSRDAAFYYLRDSITTIQLLRIDSPETMAPLPPPERSRRQRLYWQAFIHERFVAILDYRRAILPPLETLPEDDPTIPLQVHEGFNQIIALFRLLDPEFLQNWLAPHSSAITSSWIESKSRELEGDEASHAADLSRLSTMQRADLAITREWLRTLVWRLAMSQTLLSSASPQACLSLLFPVRLSQNLRHQVSQMSRHDIEAHGSSIVQKLFEITDTIADVLIHVPAPTLEETACRIDDYLFILDFVLLFPMLDGTRRGILLEKLERLQRMFPEVCSSAGSSPQVTVELMSPGSVERDPWARVASEKMGGEMGTGLQSVIVERGRGEMPNGRRQEEWNHISRRLTGATFALPAEGEYGT